MFAIFSLVIFCLMGYFVARLRNAPAGRMFIAIRSNENAAAGRRRRTSPGPSCSRSRISAFIAGIGGGLLAYQQININPASFTLVDVTDDPRHHLRRRRRADRGGGGGRLLLAGNGVMATLLNKLFDFNRTRC